MVEEAPVNPNLSQTIAAGLSLLTDGLKKLEIPLKHAILSGTVLGLKRTINKLVFKCPPRNYKLYSLLFIFVPAVMLFCLALMISKSFWEIAARCCLLPRSRRRSIWKRSRKYVYLCCFSPVVWFLFVFIDAEYYVCSKLGSLEVRLNSTTNSLEKSAILNEFQSIEAESQIIALVLLAVTLLLATIFISLDRCYTKAASDINDDQEYVQYLAEEEIKLFNTKLEPLAKEQATQHVEALFKKYEDVIDPLERVRLISKEIAKEYPWKTGSGYESIVTVL